MTTITPMPTPSTAPAPRAPTTARAADGDYLTKGTGHEVKDADGDYKATAVSSAASPAARVSASVQAALASLTKGG